MPCTRQKYGNVPAVGKVCAKVNPDPTPESQSPLATQPNGQVPDVVEWVPEVQTHWIESPTWIVLDEVPLTGSKKTLVRWPVASDPTYTVRGALGGGVGELGVGVGVGPVIVSSQPTAATRRSARIAMRASRRRSAMPRMLTPRTRPYNPRPP